ncbi:hypothetical protein ACFWZ2_35980 [Streptomyces sp. NPDC059002]|uniref:effector-associated constant component EACC1 n=1 Tax=Streptomyces sp. NPDC059002 TaxID=3346690 RepID=UPI0036A7D522
MEITLRLAEGSADDGALASLLTWLRTDASVARHTESVEGYEARRQGALDGALETIGVVATHLEALTAIAVSVAAWLQGHQRAQPVRMAREERIVVITDGSEESVAAALRVLDGAPEDASPDAAEPSGRPRGEADAP